MRILAVNEYYIILFVSRLIKSWHRKTFNPRPFFVHNSDSHAKSEMISISLSFLVVHFSLLQVSAQVSALRVNTTAQYEAGNARTRAHEVQKEPVA